MHIKSQFHRFHLRRRREENVFISIVDFQNLVYIDVRSNRYVSIEPTTDIISLCFFLFLNRADVCLIVNAYVLVISKLMLFNFRDRSDICVAFNSSLRFDCRPKHIFDENVHNRWNISIGIKRRPTRLKFINLWCLLNGPCSTIKKNIHRLLFD